MKEMLIPRRSRQVCDRETQVVKDDAIRNPVPWDLKWTAQQREILLQLLVSSPARSGRREGRLLFLCLLLQYRLQVFIIKFSEEKGVFYLLL